MISGVIIDTDEISYYNKLQTNGVIFFVFAFHQTI